MYSQALAGYKKEAATQDGTFHPSLTRCHTMYHTMSNKINYLKNRCHTMSSKINYLKK